MGNIRTLAGARITELKQAIQQSSFSGAIQSARYRNYQKMNKEEFSNSLNIAFPGSKVEYSPDFWNFIIHMNAKSWRLYVDPKLIEVFEDGKINPQEIAEFRNPLYKDYRLTIDPRKNGTLLFHEVGSAKPTETQIHIT